MNQMEQITAELNFVKLALGSFIGDPDENQRQNMLISELDSIADQNLKGQLRGYVIFSREELKRARDQLQELSIQHLKLLPSTAGTGITCLRVNVDVCSRNNVIPLIVSFHSNKSPHDEVVETLKTLKDKVKMGRHVDFSSFLLREKSTNRIITSFELIFPDIQLIFSLNDTIDPVSASDWDASYLEKLSILWDDYTNENLFFNETLDPSQSARDLVKRLAKLNSNLIAQYETSRFDSQDKIAEIRSNDILHDVILKSIFLIQKYSNNEPIVDNFLVHLFKEIGFYDGMIYAVPQFTLDLNFGSTVCTAKPDFLLMDILSYCRAAVFEEKNKDQQNYDSEPQMVAQAIASFQLNVKVDNSNAKKLKTERGVEKSSCSTLNSRESISNIIYGVRVNGLIFSFYQIPVTAAIRQAMETKEAVHDTTEVKRLCKLDFMREDHRQSIIYALDKLRNIVVKSGIMSERLLSK